MKEKVVNIELYIEKKRKSIELEGKPLNGIYQERRRILREKKHNEKIKEDK